MRDSERQELSRFVYQHLRERDFRDRLVASAPDGTKPIITVLPSDRTHDLLKNLAALGGAANVVLGVANGVLIFVMEQTGEAAQDDVHVLTADCTVGVLLARVMVDGDKGQYRFASPGDENGVGWAELVGLKS